MRKLFSALRKRKLSLIEEEARKKYKDGGMKEAIRHVELYFATLARTNNPFEKSDNIQAKSFVIDQTIVVKAYNVNTGFTYMSAQVNLAQEKEMDSDTSSLDENNTKN